MSKTVKFAAPIIGIKKPVSVKASNRTMRKIWALQLQEARMEKASTPETMDELEEAYNRTISLLDASEDFLTTTLKLTDKQEEKLEQLDQEELGELVGRLQATLSGIDVDDMQESDEEATTDPE